MEIIDRVVYEPERTGNVRNEDLLIWRWPSDSLTLGSQLIVNQSQEAIFFKGGQAVDVFGPGTHTLAADNLPLLQKLINLPFGDRTPFSAEVYFVNRHAKLDVKWGTPDPFRITDPVYHIIVPVRSFGQLGLRIADSRSFVVQVIGTLHDWNAEKLSSYFKGLVVMQTKDSIANFIVANKVSVMDVAANLDAISRDITARLVGEFARFGIEVVNFFVMSINVPDDDLSVLKIQETMASRAELEQLGENYRLKRTFDTLEKAAENEGGTAGALLGGGLGVGMGIGAMQTNMGSVFARTSGIESLLPDASRIQTIEQRLVTLKGLFDRGLISEGEFLENKKRIIEAI